MKKKKIGQFSGTNISRKAEVISFSFDIGRNYINWTKIGLVILGNFTVLEIIHLCDMRLFHFLSHRHLTVCLDDSTFTA